MAESLEMSQQLAQRLMAEGGTIVCLGMVKGSEFGIDMKSWTTAEKFLGVKMIPPGFHYIHYSNPHGDIAPRSGFVWFSSTTEVNVRKWNEKSGVFEEEPFEVCDRVKHNLRDIDSNLGAYPYEVWDKWKSLTYKITDSLAKRFVPNSGVISSALELSGSDNVSKNESLCSGDAGMRRRQRRSAPFSDVDMYGDLLPSLHAAPGTELRFSRFPELSYPPTATPTEITKFSIDSSYILGTIFMQHQKLRPMNPCDVLGELQFAFVSFLVGHSMESFEQWKRLLGVICCVEEDLPKYVTFYSELLTVLKPQLEEIPQDFLVDIVASSNFVYQSLRKLFRNIANETSNGRLQAKSSRLQEFLTQTFMWDFSDVNEEDEDEKPVIVVT